MTTFEIATAENTAQITLTDNLGRAAPSVWCIARDPRATYWAIVSYAKQHGIPARDVGYSVKVTSC